MRDNRLNMLIDEDIQEKWEELVFRLAFKKKLQQEIDDLLQTPLDDETLAFLERSKERTLKLIPGMFRLLYVKKIVKAGTWAFTSVAAVFLVAIICISTAMAIPALRGRTLELLIKMENREFTELSLAEHADLAYDIPENWEGKYLPTYVPEVRIL